MTLNIMKLKMYPNFQKKRALFLFLFLRSLSAHTDDLKLLLDSMKLPFDDILGISETNEQVNKNFLTPFDMGFF